VSKSGASAIQPIHTHGRTTAPAPPLSMYLRQPPHQMVHSTAPRGADTHESSLFVPIGLPSSANAPTVHRSAWTTNCVLNESSRPSRTRACPPREGVSRVDICERSARSLSGSLRGGSDAAGRWSVRRAARISESKKV
jgi:hypothetical protein